MIAFDPKNPFPLLPIGSYSYANAKEHAVKVDSWLGFHIQEIERKIQQSPVPIQNFPQERWVGLDAQSFLTPYIELRSMLDCLQPKAGDRVIDLGCGYGRMGHVIGKHHPLVSFIGYEIVPERALEAQRTLEAFQYPLVRIEQKDLAHERPEIASYYFIYDYGSKAAIEKTLLDLREISKQQPIHVVARGRASRFFIHKDHPWLSEVHDPSHYETFSIYHS